MIQLRVKMSSLEVRFTYCTYVFHAQKRPLTIVFYLQSVHVHLLCPCHFQFFDHRFEVLSIGDQKLDPIACVRRLQVGTRPSARRDGADAKTAALRSGGGMVTLNVLAPRRSQR